MSKPNRFRARAWDADMERMIYTDDASGDYFWCFDDDGVLEAYSVGEPVTDDPEDTGHSEKLSTPMLSTGLADKNGVEIYEGDVITYYAQYLTYPEDCMQFIGSVVFFDSMFGIKQPEEDDDTIDFINSYFGIEIIGTIHTHPELLHPAIDTPGNTDQVEREVAE